MILLLLACFLRFKAVVAGCATLRGGLPGVNVRIMPGCVVQRLNGMLSPAVMGLLIASDIAITSKRQTILGVGTLVC